MSPSPHSRGDHFSAPPQLARGRAPVRQGGSRRQAGRQTDSNEDQRRHQAVSVFHQFPRVTGARQHTRAGAGDGVAGDVQ